MILKKPYAFLIKNFRIIHLVLTIFLAYIAYKNYYIFHFFNEYVNNGYFSSDINVAGKYINFSMYFAIIIIIFIGISILLLMKQKGKPTKYYQGLLIYSIILFILFTVCYGALSNFQTQAVDIKVARMYRDISLMVTLPQYFFLIYALLRTIGFDVKKFNFSKDLQDLEIDQLDNEEFEFVVGYEGYKVKRKIRRSFRELKYYFFENTFIIIIVFLVTLTIIGTVYYMNKNVYNVTYRTNQTMSVSDFKIKNTSSFITTKSMNGDKIAKGKSYLVVNLNIVNQSNVNKKIELNNFRLMLGTKKIYPILNKNKYFIDLGQPYNNEKLTKQKEYDYMLIFEIPSTKIAKKYILRIVDNIDYSTDEIVAHYREIKLNPTNLDNIKKKEKYNINDTISLNDDIIKNSSLLIKEYEIANYYEYEYNSCINETCSTKTSIIKLDGNVSSSKTLIIFKRDIDLNKDNYYSINSVNIDNFFGDFGKIKYEVDNKTYYSDIINNNPNFNIGVAVGEVSKKIIEANSIELQLNVRNHQYNVKLK